MTRKAYIDWMESAPRWIVVFLGMYLSVHLLSLYLWHSTGLPWRYR